MCVCVCVCVCVIVDGVLYHGKSLLPGATKFVNWLNDNGKEYLFLTNSSERSPRELSEKLFRLGIKVRTLCLFERKGYTFLFFVLRFINIHQFYIHMFTFRNFAFIEYISSIGQHLIFYSHFLHL